VRPRLSIVRRRPSSSDTFGSHPSTSRARVMSGLRTLGSSIGRPSNTISERAAVSWTIFSASSSSVISSGLPTFTGWW
jgi:hypothetical protein